MKNRRVGTLTLGIVLVVVGTLFIIHMVSPDKIPYELLVRIWPIAIVMLGIEVLISYFIGREERLKIDGWSIVIMFLVLGFSACMGVMDYFITNEIFEYYNHAGYRIDMDEIQYQEYMDYLDSI